MEKYCEVNEKCKLLYKYVSSGWSFNAACAKAEISTRKANKESLTNPYARVAKILSLDGKKRQRHNLDLFIYKCIKANPTINPRQLFNKL